jgi:heat shock protein HslJ/membrane-bound inhibitor of C-type lysozyme
MTTWRTRTWQLMAALVAFSGPLFGQTPSGTEAPPLAGTSWQLVRFQGGDGKVVMPDDGSKYTLAFAADGTIAARIDCNRGRGSWKSSAPSQLELGPLALTRAMCPPQSMDSQLIKHWSYIRSYVVRNGHLFLSLMADGGNYEFQPMPAAAPSIKSPVTFKGPVTFMCGGGETLRATFYKTQPAMVLLERGGVTQPAFQVKAASGSRYEGNGVLFWEARGEATLNWMGAESICKPN